MALNNDEVLESLKSQLITVSETRLKLLGAIDVLEQIRDGVSETETPEEDERN
jgi:hypothetical protein